MMHQLSGQVGKDSKEIRWRFDMKEKESMNRMGTMPVNRLMLSMGIPMILSMMIQALYNIVDLSLIHI